MADLGSRVKVYHSDNDELPASADDHTVVRDSKALHDFTTASADLAKSDAHDQEGEDDGQSQPIAGPSRPKARNKGLYRPPTLQEMDQLRSGEATGDKGFTLKLEAILKSTLLPPIPQSSLKSLLSAIHTHIFSLPALPALRPEEAALRPPMDFPGSSTLSPFNQGAEVKWLLGWDTPSEVYIGGSWAVCGGYDKCKGRMGDIDIIVVMPRVGDRISHDRILNYSSHCFPPRTACLIDISSKGCTTSP